jgi:hypothetical protein
MNPKYELYNIRFAKKQDSRSVSGAMFYCNRSAVLANEKPVRFGRSSSPKAHIVMSMCVQWRQLHVCQGSFIEPREVTPLM